MDPYKALLQFLLITVLGGGVFAYLTARREEQEIATFMIRGALQQRS